MAYDEGLAQRVREVLAEYDGVEEKRMFGGLCFMWRQHMCCGIVGDTLMARVGAEQYQHCLALPHAREMDFTGKALQGMVYVDPAGIEADSELDDWIQRCCAFVATLPTKPIKATATGLRH